MKRGPILTRGYRVLMLWHKGFTVLRVFCLGIVQPDNEQDNRRSAVSQNAPRCSLGAGILIIVDSPYLRGRAGIVPRFWKLVCCCLSVAPSNGAHDHHLFW